MLYDYCLIPKKLIFGLVQNVDDLWCFVSHLGERSFNEMTDDDFDEIHWRVELLSQIGDLLK